MTYLKYTIILLIILWFLNRRITCTIYYSHIYEFIIWIYNIYKYNIIKIKYKISILYNIELSVLLYVHNMFNDYYNVIHVIFNTKKKWYYIS